MLLKPFNIGPYHFDTPVFLSPMAGVTDYPYRHMVRQYQAPLVYSEMAASMSIHHMNEKTQKIIDISNDTGLTSVQIAGSNLEIMAESAKVAEGNGANIIDINMGCPAKKVVNGIAGSAIMKDESLAFKIIESVVNAVKIPVTVKMRMGWDCNSINAHIIAKLAEDAGASMVAVHGRTRSQFYTGTSDWSAIKNVVNNINIPVLVNGDIKTEEDAKVALEQSEANGVLIGRGTYGKPWLINNIIEYLTKDSPNIITPNFEERFIIVKDHYNNILNYYGEESGVKIARKHIIWHTKGLKGASELRKNINILNTKAEMFGALEKCFNVA